LNKEILINRKGTVKTILLLAGLGVGWSAVYLLVTVALTSMTSVVVAAGAVTFAALFLSVMFSRQAETAINKTFASEPGLMAAFSVGLWLASAGQIVRRYSSAPSGSDTILMLSTAALFALAMAAARPWGEDRPTWGSVVAVLAVLAGSLLIVANWERPSSFNPFMLFPTEELWLLASAAGLALFAAAGRELVKRHSPGGVLTAAFWAAAPPTLIYGLISSGGLRPFLEESRPGIFILVLLGAAFAVSLVCLLRLLEKTPPRRALAAVAVMPALVTALIIVERAFGYAYLPVPFAPAPIIAGIVVTIAGVAAVWVN
jgi:drug/metabolite transporter (DMT)-like permease